MNEPEYHFRKGKGWVASYEPPYPEMTDIIGPWKIRYIDREPRPGEYHWEDSHFRGKQAIEHIVEVMRMEYWSHIICTTASVDLFAEHIPQWPSIRPYEDIVKGGQRCIVLEFTRVG